MGSISKLDAQPLVVVDVETSGTNLAAHSLMAAAFVPVNEDKPVLEVYFRPKRIEWSPRAKEMFASYETVWEQVAVPPERACAAITTYIQGVFGRPVTIVAHNVAFDFAFLRKTFHEANALESDAFSHRAVDTHTLLFLAHLKGIIPKSALSSTGAFDFFGIKVSREARHTAVGDAIATRELFRRLLEVL